IPPPPPESTLFPYTTLFRSQRAYHAGLLDRFPESTGQTSTTSPPCDFGPGKGVVMGYYDGNTVTALWNYAQNFAMSDNFFGTTRSEEHTSELQSRSDLVCRL